MYYHRPLSIKKHSNPLSDCVITMSTYVGAERTYLVTLAVELGAMYYSYHIHFKNYYNESNINSLLILGVKIFSSAKLILKKIYIEAHI